MQSVYLAVRDAAREKLENIFSHNDYDMSKAMNRDFISVFFLLTHKCNVRCPYCYQGDAYKEIPGSMSEQTLIDGLVFVARFAQKKRVTINLFGGEPLLKFDIVKKAVEDFQQFTFTITTNGRTLVENPTMMDWIRKQSNLTISLSITAMRYYYGKDYLEKAKPVLDLIHDRGRDVNFVIDDPDYPMLLDDLAFLKDYPIGELRVSMAKELNIDDELRGKFIAKWKQVIDLLYGTKAKNVISLDKYRSENNITRYCTGKEMQCDMSMFCGSGMFYLCIDTDGKIYPCDYFAQFPEFQIGDIYNGITEPNRVFKQDPQWYKKIYEHCSECPLEDIRLCLNPPCLGENFKVNKDMFKPSKSVCQVKVIEFETIKYLVEKYGCLNGHGNSCNKLEKIGDK